MSYTLPQWNTGTRIQLAPTSGGRHTRLSLAERVGASRARLDVCSERGGKLFAGWTRRAAVSVGVTVESRDTGSLGICAVRIRIAGGTAVAGEIYNQTPNQHQMT